MTPRPASWPGSSGRWAASLASRLAAPARLAGAPRERAETALSLGFVTAFLSVVVLLPMAALVWQSSAEGAHGFWAAVSAPQSVAALKLTLCASLAVSLINAVLGTLTAWVLVRDDFPGKTVLNAIIDLPFALPTIVAGLTLLALYGPRSPIGINLAFSRLSVVLALMFVTLPFVVRAVQPVLHALDREMEEAAACLGASRLATFRYVTLPTVLPGILSGGALAFAKAVGEFGSLVIITGNLPYKTEVASVYVFGRIESGDPTGAAAVAVCLLVLSFAVLLSIGVVRRLATRHERA